MLKALVRWLWPPEASRTQNDPAPRYVTHDQLDEALAKFSKQTEWMMDEWYEKFSTLHARAEKRVNRDKKNRAERGEVVEEEPQRVTALMFRRPGSA